MFDQSKLENPLPLSLIASYVSSDMADLEDEQCSIDNKRAQYVFKTRLNPLQLNKGKANLKFFLQREQNQDAIIPRNKVVSDKSNGFDFKK